MPPLIYSLVPNSYNKKPLKPSNELQAVDRFIAELKARIVDDWNYQLEIDNSNGSGYKIKFEQFEKKFLNKSDFVVYIVTSISLEAFRNCVKKLLKSCKEAEKLSKIIVLSINVSSIEELNCTPIGFVCFASDSNTDRVTQWETLNDLLKGKANSHLKADEIPKTESLAIPSSNSGRKSPSRFKSFFNSLPSRFHSEGKRVRDSDLPDINVSDVENVNHEDKRFTLPRRQKVDSTKLSLNSLFRRRSKKARDSGLSMGSSNSTGSGSRKSETIITRGSLIADDGLNIKSDQSSSSEQPPVMLNASLNKAQHQKAKIEIFKQKANKAIRSTSCLKSPKQKKHKCAVGNVMNEVVHFSSELMTASSNIGNQSEKIVKKQRLDRGHSEPPNDSYRNLSMDSLPNRRIKYYSWNEDSSEEREFDEKMSSALNESILEANEFDSLKGLVFHNGEGSSDKSQSLLNDHIVLDDVFYTTFKPSNTEPAYNGNEHQLIVNHGDSDITYSTFIASDVTRHPNHSMVNKSDDSGVSPDQEIDENVSISVSDSEDHVNNDPMASLNRLIHSIQMGYGDGQDLFTNKDDNNIETNFYDKQFGQQELEIIDSITPQRREFELNAKPLTNYNPASLETEIVFNMNDQTLSKREMSPELISVADLVSKSRDSPPRLVRNIYQSLVRNPLFVTGLFAATTYTAPMWSTVLPSNVCISKLFYGTLDFIMYGDIVQSLPNQIISTGRSGASAASNTLKRFLILLPTPWFNIFKVVPA